MSNWLTESDYRPDDGVADIVTRMGELVTELGMEHFSFAMLRAPGNQPFDIIETLHTSYPDEWIDRYAARRYVELDPVACLAPGAIRPFFWGQGRFLRGFKKQQRQVFDEANVFDISYGLAIPVRGPDGELSIFNMVSPDKRHLQDVTRAVSNRLMAAAYDTHARVMRDQIPTLVNVEAGVTLSIRERECLSWTLEGKTAEDIATILCLSVSTVNQHAVSATRKLGCQNKHHAAVKALRSGMIQ